MPETGDLVVQLAAGLVIGLLLGTAMSILSRPPASGVRNPRASSIVFVAMAATIALALWLSTVDVRLLLLLAAVGAAWGAALAVRAAAPGAALEAAPPTEPSPGPTVVDLHVHYPRHLTPGGVVPMQRGERRGLLRRVFGWYLRLIDRLTRPLDTPRVTVPLMRQGGVGLAFSALYLPFEELSLTEPYGSPPREESFAALVALMHLVEQEVSEHHGRVAAVVHDLRELEAVLADGRLGLVHCVEGGFHLGGTPASVQANVADLARRGVAYVTLAHSAWRGIATAAAPESRLGRLLFRQPPIGLSDLGRAAVTAMVRENVLVDVTHMSRAALEDTFALLDELDPAGEVPVLATHTAYRFGGRQSNLTDDTIRAIARRDGLIGLILAEEPLRDGLRRGRTRSLLDTLAVVTSHIDRIAELTGSYDHVALGSDYDGLMPPPPAGLESPADLGDLTRALAARYGGETAGKIAHGNALRLMRALWGRSGESATVESAP